MSLSTGTDWDPGTYGRFRGLRLRPAVDLLAQVPDLPPGPVVDLGCGAGAVAPALKARFADRPLHGVDTSPTMLAEAEEGGRYDLLARADAAEWRPDAAPALIFSNAALHWLPDHARLFPRLAGLLAPGGVLAIQMPRQQMGDSHRLLREIAARMFPERFDLTGWTPQVAAPANYAEIFAPLGRATIWETEYYQQLAPVDEGHPVRHFTASTAMRPYAERLTEAEQAAYLARYDAELSAAYPLRADGSALFPFRRLFMVLATGD